MGKVGHIKWIIVICGLAPVVAWASSLIYHWTRFGHVFVWNDVAYLPLLLTVFPLKGIYNLLGIDSHVKMFLFAGLGGAIYAGIATVVLLPVLIERIRRRDGNDNL